MKSVSAADAPPDARGRGGGQDDGAGRRGLGVRRDLLGIIGAFSGLSGETRGAVWLGWACTMGLTGLVIALNIIAGLQRDPGAAVGVLVDEPTSAAALAVAYAAPAAVALWLRRALPETPMALSGGVLGLAMFSAVHIGGCEALRALIEIVVLQAHYRPGMLSGGLPFELAKDALAYLAALTGFTVFLRWRLASLPASAQDSLPEVFDIRDGARVIRVALDQILAVRAAGNYAEFVLTDGRRPLMRTSLAALETRLARQGFVRTHRGWLVNAARVTGLKPEGSGDYSVELGEVEAPLSRRFPEALTALRSGQVGQSGRAILTG